MSKPRKNTFSRTWDIHDAYRDALFCRIFFERRLVRLQRASLLSDIVVAVGASTTGIAGWALWSEPIYKQSWAGFAGLAATLAILKPTLNWSNEISKISRLFGQYSALEADYRRLESDISYHQGLTDEILARSDELEKRCRWIEQVPMGTGKILDKIQDEVNRKIPVERLWSPER